MTIKKAKIAIFILGLMLFGCARMKCNTYPNNIRPKMKIAIFAFLMVIVLTLVESYSREDRQKERWDVSPPPGKELYTGNRYCRWDETEKGFE